MTARPSKKQQLLVQSREYPKNVNPAHVDNGVSAIFREFQGDTWREASLREVVGTLLSSLAESPCTHTSHTRQHAMRFGHHDQPTLHRPATQFCNAHNGSPEYQQIFGRNDFEQIDEWSL